MFIMKSNLSWIEYHIQNILSENTMQEFKQTQKGYYLQKCSQAHKNKSQEINP